MIVDAKRNSVFLVDNSVKKQQQQQQHVFLQFSYHKCDLTYVTRFYKTNPNRSVSDKIKLIPPLEDGFKKHLFLVAWQDRMVDSGLVKDLRISGVLVDGLTRIVGQTFSVLILLHISH